MAVVAFDPFVMKRDSFAAFSARKTSEAAGARLLPFRTIEVTAAAAGLEEIGSDFTRALFDGPFFQSPVPAGRPHISLVFVQSQDGNTGADDPGTLGAGDTDKHLIYEGLVRADADAVLAGAKTVGDGNLIFSVWHPELVALRRSLGRRRHPVQIVATRTGAAPLEHSLLCENSEAPLVVLTAQQAESSLAERLRGCTSASIVSAGPPTGMRVFAERLRREFAIERVSAIGGRSVATALVDAGLVSDLYLTTSPRQGGLRNTPWYAGAHPPHRDLVLRKQDPNGVLFEHWLLMRR